MSIQVPRDMPPPSSREPTAMELCIQNGLEKIADFERKLGLSPGPPLKGWPAVNRRSAELLMQFITAHSKSDDNTRIQKAKNPSVG